MVARHSGSFYIGECAAGAPSLPILAVFYRVCGFESFAVSFYELVSHDDDTQKDGGEGIESSSTNKKARY